VGNGFQSAVEKATDTIAQGARVRRDLLDGLPLRARDPRVRGVRGEVDGAALSDGRDPHVWVDPRLFARMARGVEAALIEADPAGRAVYEQNADTYVDGLEALDREFESTLTTCRSTTLVTSHAAFGYLADRYGLKQAPIAGISPDDEPDPKSLAATAALARADGVTTVFFETLVPRKLAETVAREIGARTDALDPVEGLTSEAQAAGATYTSVQSDNLDRLARGLECTRA
jgi:zinc transport system substrate-binding protein